MKDVEAGRHRLALNKRFRKSSVNKYTECRVCNFKDRSVIVVNAARGGEWGIYRRIDEIIMDYCEDYQNIRELTSSEAQRSLWVLT